MAKKSPTAKTLIKRDFENLSEFRYQLRRFLRFSENAAQNEGLTPLQYLLLLHIKGFPGREWATVGELAERLQAHHHGVVALISRCEERRLIKRKESMTDRRQVEVHLSPKGERCLDRLVALHRSELDSMRGTFKIASLTAFNDDDGKDAS